MGGSAVAQTPFTDDFEDPAINPFWTILDQAGSGSVNLDTAFAHGGNQSVEVHTDSFGGVEALLHSFQSPAYGTVSVWVYYSNTTATGYKMLDIFNGPASSGSDYNLYIDWGNLETYVKDSSGASRIVAPPQSTGWHNWTFSSMPSGVTIEIDGVQVFTQPVAFAFQTVQLRQCCLAGSAFFDDFRFTSATAYSCAGFQSPFDVALSLKQKVQRAIPLKMQLLDASGNVVTDTTIAGAAPVVNINYTAVNSTAVDETSLLDPIGQSSNGNSFSYNSTTQTWQYNLSSSPFSASGTYTVTVTTGDATQYSVSPTCSGTFVRK